MVVAPAAGRSVAEDGARVVIARRHHGGRIRHIGHRRWSPGREGGAVTELSGLAETPACEARAHRRARVVSTRIELKYPARCTRDVDRDVAVTTGPYVAKLAPGVISPTFGT